MAGDANGSALSVQLRDAFGNAAGNVSVAFASSNANDLLSPSCLPTDASGQASFVIRSTQAGLRTLSATAGSVSVTTLVTVRAASPNQTQSSLVVTPNMVVADGNAAMDVVASLRDAFGNPASGQTVAFAATGSANLFDQNTTTTDATGSARAKLKSTRAETKTVSGASGGLTWSQAAQFVSGTPNSTFSNVSATPSTVVADNVQLANVTVLIGDGFGNPIANQSIALSSNNTNAVFAAASGTTDAGGSFVTSVRSSLAMPTVLRAQTTGGAAVVTTTLQFIAGPPSSATSSIVASPNAMSVDNANGITIVVTARDAQSNLVTGTPVSSAASGSSNVFTPASGNTTAQGTWTSKLTSSRAQPESVTATFAANGAAVAANVVFVAGSPNAAQWLATLVPASPVAGANASFQVTIRDSFANVVPGAPVNFVASGAGNAFSPTSATSDGNGWVSTTFSSTVAQHKTLTATSGAASLPYDMNVQPAAAQSSTSSIAFSANATVADSVSALTVTGVVRDAYNNVVPLAPYTLSASGSSNVFSAVSGITDANGALSSTLRSTRAETKTITLSAGTATVNGTSVFVAGQPNGTASSLAASPNQATANGSSAIGLTAVMADAFGNLVPNASVLFSVTGSGATLSPTSATSNASGQATSTLTSSVAETKTAQAQSGNAVVQTTVQFVAGSSSGANSSLTLSPNVIAASDSSGATVNVWLRDANNNAVANSNITLTNSGASTVFGATSGTSDANGRFATTVRSTVAQTESVAITFEGNQTLSAQMTFVAASPNASRTTFTASPTSTPAGTTSTLSLVVRDAFNNVVPNANIALSASAQTTLAAPSVLTASDGTASTSLASSVAGNYAANANVSGGLLAANVTFVPASPNTTASTLVASPNTVTANGNNAITLTATIRDAFANVIAGQSVAFSATGSSNLFAAANGNTNASGVYATTLVSTVAQGETVTATAGTANPSITVTFTAGSPNASQSSVALSPATQVADGASVIAVTATVRDAFANPVPSQTTSLSTSGTNNTLSISGGSTNANGVLQSNWKSTKAETKTLTATAAGISFSSAATFVAGAPSSTTSSFAISPTNVTADNNAAATLAVTVKDVNGNPAPGLSVTFSTSSNVTLQPVSPVVTDANGLAQTLARSSLAHVESVSASVGNVTLAGNLIFIPGAASAQTSTVTITPSLAVVSDVNTVSVTATARDAQSNVIGNSNVSFSASGANNTFSVLLAATNASGVVSTALRSTLQQNEIITATFVGGAAVSANVAFIAASPNTSQSSLALFPGAGSVAGARQQFVVTARDAFGNACAANVATLTISPNTGVSLLPSTYALAAGQSGNDAISTVAETKGVTASLGTASLQANWLVVPANANATQTSFAAAPLQAVADSVAAITLSATVRDAYSNVIPNAAFALSATGGNVLIVPSTPNTNASGGLSAQATSTVAGAKTFTLATTGNAPITLATQNANFIAGAPNATMSTIAVSPATLTADNVTTSLVKATFRDAYGNAAGNVVCNANLSGIGGSISPSSASTDANGYVQFSARSSVAETKTVALTASGASLFANITFTPGAVDATASTVSVSPNVIAASMATAANVTFVARDVFGNAVSGANVMFAPSGSATTIVPNSLVTGTDGSARAGVSATLAQNENLVATAGNVSLLARLMVVAASPNAATSMVALSPTAAVAGNNVVVTATFVDSFGNPTPSQNVSFAVTGAGAALSPNAATTDGNGLASSVLSSSVAEVKTVTATTGGISVAANVTFSPASPNSSQTTLSAAPASQAVDAAPIALTAVVRDAFGNRIARQSVSFASSGSAESFVPASGTTDGNGSLASQLSSTLASSPTLSISAGAATASTSVTFVAGSPNAARTFVAAQPNVTGSPNSYNALTAGQLARALTVLGDRYGNAVPGQSVTLSVINAQNVALAFNGNAGMSAADGSFVSSFTPTVAGAYTLRAVAGAMSASANLTVGPAAANGTISTFVASPTTATADGAAPITLTATIRDAYANVIAGQGVSFASTGTSNSFGAAGGTSDANGVYTTLLRSTKAESKQLTASFAGNALQANVSFVAGSATSASSSLTLTPNVQVVATTSAVQVLIKDAFNNPVSSAPLTLSADGNRNTFVATSGNTDVLGSFSTQLTSLTAQTENVIAMTGNVVVTAPVTWVAGAANAILSTVAVSPNAVTAGANGNVTFWISDAYGNAVPGASVTLSVSGLNTTLSQNVIVSDTTGRGTTQLTSTLRQTEILTASTQNITWSANFAILAASPNAMQSSFVAQATSAVANGQNAIVVLLTLRDAYANAVPSQAVTFTTSGTSNTVTPGVGSTDTNGTLAVSVTSTKAENKTIAYNAGTATGNVVVTFVSGQPNSLTSTLTLTPNTQVADNTNIMAISAVVLDAFGNPVASQPVSLACTGIANTFSVADGNTDASGAFASSLRSSRSGAKTVTLTAGSASVSRAATFVAGPPLSANTTLTASPNGGVTANGNAAISLLATVGDAFGNPVVAQNVTVAVPGNVVLSSASGSTDANGQWSTLARSTVAASPTASLSAGPASANATLTFLAGPPSSSNMTLSASPNQQTADGTNTIILLATVRDSFANAVAGQSVSLSATGTSNVFAQTTGTTASNGQFSTTMKSTKAEAKTITLTAAAATAATGVVFVAGAPSGTVSTLAASPNANVVADAATASVLTLVVRDAYGNALANQNVSFTVSDANATVSPSSALSDANGQVVASGRSRLASTQAFTASFSSLSLSANVAFRAGSPNATQSTFVASPNSGLDTSMTVNMTATWRDAFANVTPGISVLFAASGNNVTVSPNVVTTNAAGVAATSLAARQTQNVVVTAQAANQILNSNVSFAAAQSSLVLSPNVNVIAALKTTGTATARMYNNDGSVAANTRIRIATAGPSGVLFAAPSGMTDPNGMYSTSFRTILAGPKLVTATVANQQTSASLQAIPANGFAPNYLAFPSPVGPPSLQASAFGFSDLNGDTYVDAFVADFQAASIKSFVALSPGVLSTTPAYNNLIGLQPWSMAIADFSRDGNVDVIVSGPSPSTIKAFVSVGNGNLAIATNQILFTSSVSCNRLYSADINRDGYNDIVSVCQETNGVRVHLNNGSGTFAAPTSILVGGKPEAAQVVDFDGDGNVDLIVANSGASGPSLLMGAGNGNFTAASAISLSANTTRVAAADLDQDGNYDLVFVSPDAAYAKSIGVAYGTSRTTFGAPQSVPSCYKPSGVATARFSGTSTDVVVSCNGGSVDNGRYYSLAGTGNLALVSPRSFLVGAGVNGLSVADVNLDGFADVVGLSTISSVYSPTFSILLGSGQGLMAPQVAALSASNVGNNTAYRRLALADVDNDGDLDVVCSNNRSGAGYIDILLNQNGVFAPPISVACSGTGYETAPSLADADGDGVVDLLINDKYLSSVNLFLGNGNGSFRSGVAIPVDSNNLSAIFANLSGDVLPSIIVASRNQPRLQVYGNAGSGNFLLRQQLFAFPALTYLGLGDFDGDGAVDLFASTALSPFSSVTYRGLAGGFLSVDNLTQDGANYTQLMTASIADINGDALDDVLQAQAQILTSTGGFPLSFTSSLLQGARYASSMPILADVTGDGLADAVVLAPGSTGGRSSLHIMRNQGGTFAAPVAIAPLVNVNIAGAGDLDGDGLIDLVYTTFGDNSGAISSSDANTFPAHLVVALNRSAVLSNNLSSPTLSLTTTQNTIVADGTTAVTVTGLLTTAQGNALAGASVSFSTNGGSISLSPSSVVSDANGKVTAALSTTLAQNIILTASSSATASTLPLSFIAGSPNGFKCSYTASPTSFVATSSGKASLYTIRVADAFNNPCIGRVVTFAMTGGAPYFGTSSCTLDANGSCQVGFSTTTPGSQTVRANPGPFGLVAGVTVTSSPNVALSSLSISPASGITANGTAAATVSATALDDNNTPIASLPVSFFVSGLGGVISPVTGATDSNGKFVAALSSQWAGTASIQVSLGGVNLSSNATFTAAAAPSSATSFVSALPVQVPTGAIGTKLVVFVADANGNPLIGQNVMLSASSGSLTGATTNTDQNGLVTASLSDQNAEIVSVNANIGNLIVSSNVTFYSSAAASSLAVAGLTGGPAPAVSDVYVSVLDSNGRLAANYTGTIKFTSSDPCATYPANYTFTSADRGFHIFRGGVSLPTTGLQNVVVQDVSNTNLLVISDQLLVGQIDSNVYISIASAAVADRVLTTLPVMATPGAGIILSRTSGGFGQSFAWLADGRLRQNGLCMDLKNGAAVAGASMAMATCSASLTQRWARSGKQWTNLADPTLCVDFGPSLQGRPRLAPCQNRLSQSTSTVVVTPQYRLFNFAGDQILDVSGRNRSVGYPISCTNTYQNSSQALIYDQDLSLQFRGMCIGLKYGLAIGGAALQLSNCDGTAVQKFVVTNNSMRPLTDQNLCINYVTGGGTAVLQPCVDSTAQRFIPMRSAAIDSLVSAVENPVAYAVGFAPGAAQGANATYGSPGDLNYSFFHSANNARSSSQLLFNWPYSNMMMSNGGNSVVYLGPASLSNVTLQAWKVGQQWTGVATTGAATYSLDLGTGWYNLIDGSNTALNATVRTTTATTGINQQFFTIPRDIRLRSLVNPNLCLEVPTGRGISKSTNLAFRPCGDFTGQHFTPAFLYDGQASTVIDFGLMYGTQVVGPSGAFAAGAQIVVDSPDFIGGFIARWVIDNPNGHLVLSNSSTLCLDGGAVANGVVPTIQTCSASASQAFMFTWGDSPVSSRSYVTASSPSIVASNTNSLSLTATFQDSFGIPSSNQQVTQVVVSGSNNTISSLSGLTDLGGNFTFSVSSTTAETKSVSVFAGAASASTTFAVVASSPNRQMSRANVALNNVPASNQGNAVITITLADTWGNLVPSAAVQPIYRAEDVNVFPASLSSSAMGQGNFTVTSMGIGAREVVFVSTSGIVAIASPNFTQPTTFCDPNGGMNFSSPRSFGLAGGSYNSMATLADINGDGNVDLVINGTSTNANTFSYFMNGGRGNLKSRVQRTVPGCSYTKWVGSADLNKDGRGDLIFGCSSSNAIVVSLASSANDYTSFVSYSAMTNVDSIVVGDFNGDGKLDFVSSSVLSPLLQLFVGDGAGNFSSASSFTDNYNINLMFGADFNGDGRMDVVTASSSTTGTSYRADSNGQLMAASQSLNFILTPIAFSAGDYDGDGLRDLAYATSGNRLFFGHGNGNNTFLAFASTAMPGSRILQAKLDSVDLNGDGLTDIVTRAGYTVIPMYGGAGGNWLSGGIVEADWDTVTFIGHADLNGDGRPDIVQTTDRRYVAWYTSSSGAVDSRPMIDIEVPVNLEIADFDGDGNQDIVSLSQSGNIWLLRNSGNGMSFSQQLLATSAAYNTSYFGERPKRRMLVDIDQDGLLDVIAVPINSNYTPLYNVGGNSLVSNQQAAALATEGAGIGFVYWASFADIDGDGAFDSIYSQGNQLIWRYFSKSQKRVPDANRAIQTLTVGSSAGDANAYSGVVGDINYDGLVDTLVSVGGGNIYVFLNSGGSFSSIASTLATSISPGIPAMHLRDLNGDSYLDLVFLLNPGPVKIFFGTSQGTFTSSATMTSTNGQSLPSAYGYALDFADFNGDGLLDLAGLGGDGVSVQINTGSGSSYVGSSLPWARLWRCVAVGDLNSDGKWDVISSSSYEQRIGVMLQSSCQ